MYYCKTGSGIKNLVNNLETFIFRGKYFIINKTSVLFMNFACKELRLYIEDSVLKCQIIIHSYPMQDYYLNSYYES